ncbi:MAG: AMIN domain-containing protein [Sulfurovum sp.]|nr:AMIN domain-containing protein [Sulfurovum sp.]
MKRLLFFLFLGTVWAFASIAILEKAELKKRELQLHFNGSYDKGKIRHFTLKHPYREVFDIPNARLKHSHIGKNLISPHCYSIRISQYKKNTVRITLETGKKYVCKPYRSFFAYNVYHIPLPSFRVKHKTHKRKREKEKKNFHFKDLYDSYTQTYLY